MTRNTNIIQALHRSVSKINGTHEHLATQRTKERLGFGIHDINMLLNGGLTLGDMHEFRCSHSRDMGSATGFLLAHLSRLNECQPILWIREASAKMDSGTLFPDGFMHLGSSASRLIDICPLNLKDSLWTAGEAVRAGGLAAVVLHIKGNPVPFDLSVSRKLMLRAQTSGTPLFILRQAGQEEASSATTRWHIKPEPSLPDGDYQKGVGQLRLTLTLERNRNGQTGQWLIAWNPQTRSFEHAAHHSELRSSSSKPVSQATHSLLPFHPSADRPDQPSTMGQSMAREYQRQRVS